MTDLQVKYQTLMEQQRHNVEQENVAEREVVAKEQLTDAQVDKILQELKLIAAQTGLTNVNRFKSQFLLPFDVATGFSQSYKNVASGARDIVESIVGKLGIGSFGGK